MSFIEKVAFKLGFGVWVRFWEKIRGKAVNLKKSMVYAKAKGLKTSSHFMLETQAEIVDMMHNMVGNIGKNIFLVLFSCY